MSNLRRRWRPLVSASTLASLLALAAPTHAQEPTMQIRLELDDTTLTATLDDTPSTREFLAQLPMEQVLQDYAETEKISDLPRRLTTEGAPDGYTPRAGDLAYYAPWGNLAIFHRDFRFSRGLVRLGRLDGGVEALRQAGPLRVVIRRLEP
ncbi:cyclophilin-like fold protein [Pseudomonas sp. zfem003]|uniref:cyclophilin-like fold protein n=1 Tax=Pseudomonas sp. zfem003 TaxID=3078198 RepID=UPI002928A6D6|nr:cyclophilin-like fold protein [Pseudomonas sp. zfem003]MDU9395176.1 cyclophilin-like fold protein [Pseudomonas sp. zfem003]